MSSITSETFYILLAWDTRTEHSKVGPLEGRGVDRANYVLMNFVSVSIVRRDLLWLRDRKLIYEQRFLLQNGFNEENGRILGIKYIYNYLFNL